MEPWQGPARRSCQFRGRLSSRQRHNRLHRRHAAAGEIRGRMTLHITPPTRRWFNLHPHDHEPKQLYHGLRATITIDRGHHYPIPDIIRLHPLLHFRRRRPLRGQCKFPLHLLHHHSTCSHNGQALPPLAIHSLPCLYHHLRNQTISPSHGILLTSPHDLARPHARRLPWPIGRLPHP